MDINFSSKLTVFAFRFSEQITSKGKYLSLFSLQMEAIVYVSLHLSPFCPFFLFSEVDPVDKRKAYVSQNVLRIKIHLGGKVYVYDLTELLIPNSENTIS